MCKLVYSMHACEAHHITGCSQGWGKKADWAEDRSRKSAQGAGGWWYVLALDILRCQRIPNWKLDLHTFMKVYLLSREKELILLTTLAT